MEEGWVEEWKKGRREEGMGGRVEEGWVKDGRMFYNLSESRRPRKRDRRMEEGKRGGWEDGRVEGGMNERGDGRMFYNLSESQNPLILCSPCSPCLPRF